MIGPFFHTGIDSRVEQPLLVCDDFRSIMLLHLKQLFQITDIYGALKYVRNCGYRFSDHGAFTRSMM
jgi:hypothetical protein